MTGLFGRPRHRARTAILRGRTASSEALEPRRLFSTYTVTSAADSGPGSLAQAITNANANGGADVIRFAIPGAGVHVITRFNELPAINDAVTIDGTTQPGYTSSPLITIDGSNVGATDAGLAVNVGNCTIKGLRVQGFQGDGIVLAHGNCVISGNVLVKNTGAGLSTGSGSTPTDPRNLITGNFIGTDPAGTSGLGNGHYGINLSYLGPSATIGGTTRASRNVISNNASGGISVGASDTIIQGNYIGTNPAGTAALGSQVYGIEIQNVATNARIGGTAAGAGNLISGAGQYGILYDPAYFDTNTGTIQGNLIGTDFSGTKAVGNQTGIGVLGYDHILIGGTVAGARNIISGNFYGITITYPSAIADTVQGNYIGTDITGTKAVPNQYAGIDVDQQADGIVIGGTTAAARNIISGNGTYGVYLAADEIPGNKVTFNKVQGNYIGTDVTGIKAIPNGSGLAIQDNYGNTIGGTTRAAANIISGNKDAGVQIISGTDYQNATGNVIEGNFIGTAADGTTAMGNGGAGILLPDLAGATRPAKNNLIGGTAAGAGNVIAYNKGAGVSILVAQHIAIRRNSIFSNGGIGIDLGANGVTANDALDTDGGPNFLLNFPTLTSAMSTAATTTVKGTYSGLAAVGITLEFFASASADPSGYGEGTKYLGSLTVTTDSTGKAAFSVPLSIGALGGQYITATATDPGGDTSEFSRAVLIGGVKPPATISGSVFNDANSNAKRDTTEAGLSGWTIFIDKNNNGVIDTGETKVTTDSKGNWTISGLAAGSYVVRVVPKSGYTLTVPATKSYVVKLSGGQVFSTAIFGEHKT